MMLRLMALLAIVIGLGLLFPTPANAFEEVCIDRYHCNENTCLISCGEIPRHRREALFSNQTLAKKAQRLAQHHPPMPPANHQPTESTDKGEQDRDRRIVQGGPCTDQQRK